MTIDTEDYYRELEQAWYQEFLNENRVHRTVTYHAFVSKSKGIRNGKRRPRKYWKEVELIRYGDGRFTQAHRFPFDKYATEIFGKMYKPDEAENMLREQIPIYANRG